MDRFVVWGRDRYASYGKRYLKAQAYNWEMTDRLSEAKRFNSLSEAKCACAGMGITNKVARLVKRPKVKPGTIGYVVRFKEYGELLLDYRSADEPIRTRQVFKTREEAEKIQARGYGPYNGTCGRVVLAVVRKHKVKPGTIGYVVSLGNGEYAANENWIWSGPSAKMPAVGYACSQRKVFATRAEAETVRGGKSTRKVLAVVRR